MPRYAGRHTKRNWTKTLRRSLVVALILLVVLYPLTEPLMVQVEEKNLYASDLPDGVERIRVIYLTDIHDGAFFNSLWLNMLVRQVNSLYGDLVIFGGDYRDDPAGAIRFFEKLPKIHARYGVCAVLGSHDRPEDPSQLSALINAMHSKSVVPLVNDVLPLRLGQGTIYIAGTDDVHHGQPDIPAVSSQVRREDYVIYASHSPAVIPESLNATDMDGKNGWYDLGLFGETHGGQIALAGNLLKLSDVSDRYRQGWLQENRINLLISRGIGMSVVPFRLFCSPQIHVITLVNDKKSKN